MEELIRRIIDDEWELFHTVNGDYAVSCQNDRPTFEIMRRAQYEAWSQEALELYAADLAAATAEGRNIVREKYIHMMRTTAPLDYVRFASELPPVSEEKLALTSEIWAHHAAQNERMKKEFPFIALEGRPLYAKDEYDGWASIETYQTSELLTYSEATLRALLAHIETLEAAGQDFAYIVREKTVTGLGYPDMETAEKAMMKQVMEELELQIGGGCCCGGSCS